MITKITATREWNGNPTTYTEVIGDSFTVELYDSSGHRYSCGDVLPLPVGITKRQAKLSISSASCSVSYPGAPARWVLSGVLQ